MRKNIIVKALCSFPVILIVGYFVPAIAVIHLQMLARYVARDRGFDVDKPRNLAKSVTVE